MEHNQQCVFDWVKVFDTNGTLLKQVCGFLSQDLVRHQFNSRIPKLSEHRNFFLSIFWMVWFSNISPKIFENICKHYQTFRNIKKHTIWIADKIALYYSAKAVISKPGYNDCWPKPTNAWNNGGTRPIVGPTVITCIIAPSCRFLDITTLLEFV